MSLYSFLLNNKTLVLAFVALFVGRFLAAECAKRAAAAFAEAGAEMMDDFRRKSDRFMRGGPLPGFGRLGGFHEPGERGNKAVQKVASGINSGWSTAAAFFQFLVVSPAGIIAFLSVCVHVYAAL